MLALRCLLSRPLGSPRPIFLSRPLGSPRPLFRSLSTLNPVVEPSLDISLLQATLADAAPDMAESLSTSGYFTTTNVVSHKLIMALRLQAENLRRSGRFEQSYSEFIGPDGTATRFDKGGVFACEPDGADYEEAPDMLLYMSALISGLPPLLNERLPRLAMSAASFNAKLAVTKVGGSTYPLHVDNPSKPGNVDTRKLTTILYLNPGWREGDGGELRLHLLDGEVLDLTPKGGRLVCFWADEIPHEVLPTMGISRGENLFEDDDRYALTVWQATEERENLHRKDSKFRGLADEVFR